MRITIDFDSWDEMEAFRTSGKKTRGKGKDEPEEVQQPQQGGQPTMPAINTGGFVPPQTAMQGFPGAVTAPATPQVHPLVGQIVAKIDGAIASGQPADNLANWFRNLLGPDAASATLDQIKQVYIPRLAEPQLKQLAPQLGIPVT